ncbi:MAG: glycosyltransferase family 2 protein [Pseudomonadota bacterium]|nr:glycosyltransferase family 2 protein [Pseudomonadota bacterium]MEC9300950.1 glycosyltransferase family 2 protein [Pseudomonadota bacterium]
MITDPKIAILLSTYNGTKYLEEQLDSILNQTYSNYVIVARDDGSYDDTIQLLNKYAKKFTDKFHLLEQDLLNLGASDSFSYLIEYVLENKQSLGLESAYMMFCDQDDIWSLEKIHKQIDEMLKVEKQQTGTKPIPVLIHSNLRVVSEEKSLIAESFVHYQGLEIERNRFTNLVISNVVTGCTVFINEALARKAVPVSKEAIMHDWWLSLVASAFGKLVFIDAPLVSYRQHDANAIGAKESVKSTLVGRSFWQKTFGCKSNAHLSEVARQAADFRNRFGQELTTHDNIGLRISSCMGAKVGILQRIFYRIARRF